MVVMGLACGSLSLAQGAVNVEKLMVKESRLSRDVALQEAANMDLMRAGAHHRGKRMDHKRDMRRLDDHRMGDCRDRHKHKRHEHRRDKRGHRR